MEKIQRIIEIDRETNKDFVEALEDAMRAACIRSDRELTDVLGLQRAALSQYRRNIPREKEIYENLARAFRKFRLKIGPEYFKEYRILMEIEKTHKAVFYRSTDGGIRKKTTTRRPKSEVKTGRFPQLENNHRMVSSSMRTAKIAASL